MATTEKVLPEIAELSNLIQGVAKNFIDKVYGPQGPEWGTRFRDVEELAVQIGRTISQQVLTQALKRQAAEPVPPAAQICSSCAGPMTAGPPEPRIVTTRAGDAEWSEPSSSCPRCRRAFFPSVEISGD